MKPWQKWLLVGGAVVGGPILLLITAGVVLAALELVGVVDLPDPPPKERSTGEGSERKARKGTRVIRVIDGDTVVLTRFGKTRLIGVDTPEEGRCGDNAATRFTRRRLEGKRVEFELGKDRKDRYDRTLAYLTRDDTMHNLALVDEGYARVLTIPPNDKYAGRFEAAEVEAKQQNEGALADCERDRRRALSRKRARDRERAEERRRAARLARRLRAAERRERAAERRAERRERAAERRAERRRRGGDSGGGSSGGGSSGGGSSGFACGPGDIDGDNDGRCNE